MPEGRKTDRIYKALVRRGHSKGSAARIAQSVTKKSLKTGKAPKKQ